MFTVGSPYSEILTGFQYDYTGRAVNCPGYIIQETPDFEPFLLVSRLESEISRIITEVLPFLVDSTF